jgi:hypothetical protein
MSKMMGSLLFFVVGALVFAQTPDIGLYDLTRETTLTDKLQLCQKNQDACGKACDGKVLVNTCDVSTLLWSCVCDGSSPNILVNSFPIAYEQCERFQQYCLYHCVINYFNQTCGTSKANFKTFQTVYNPPVANTTTNTTNIANDLENSASSLNTRAFILLLVTLFIQ